MTRPIKATGTYWYDRAHEAEARLELALAVVRAAQELVAQPAARALPGHSALRAALAAFEEGNGA